MAALLPYITADLRFPTDDILCRGDRWHTGCASADGQPAYAIHTYQGDHFCAYHSPFDNKYVPCETCGEKPALATDPVCDDCNTGHVCDETAERAAYQRYVSDGIADTDGHYAPENFEAWRTHYHRSIGHTEPREADCTDTECNAPQHEKTRCTNLGTARKPQMVSLCPDCYERRGTPRARRA